MGLFSRDRRSNARKIIEEYMPQYLRYSEHRFPTLSEAEREDLFMDAVLKFLKKEQSGQYEEQGKLKSFLFQIANGLVINRINHLKMKTEKVEKVNAGMYEARVALSTEEHAHLQFFFDKILKQLKPLDQTIVIYRFVYNYSYEVIAERLSLPSPEAAKSRWNYIKSKIKPVLDQNKDIFLD